MNGLPTISTSDPHHDPLPPSWARCHVRRVPRQVVRHGISDPTIDGHTYVAMVDGATGSPTGATMEPCALIGDDKESV